MIFSFVSVRERTLRASGSDERPRNPPAKRLMGGLKGQAVGTVAGDASGGDQKSR
jgi:hypothetical protein